MSDHDLWQVKLSEGCVVEMTLDEIDTAFNAGRISARTSVVPPGDFRWTTLGDAAGLEDEEREAEPAPYSIAPVAYEMNATPQPPLYDFGGDDIDVDLESNAGLPKRRGVFGKVVGVTVIFGVLVAVGVGGGAYAARPAEFKAKVASVKDRITHGSAPAKAAAAPAPPPPPVQAAPVVPPPPPAVAPPPAPATPPTPPTPTMQASASGTSVANLPDAKGKKAPAKKKH